MQVEWMTFLKEAGAEYNGTRLKHFGNPEAEGRVVLAGDVMTDCTNFGYIQVSGPDAKTFLQGQLTCNLEEITTTKSALGAHCTPKGRVISLFRLFLYQDDYYLRLPSSMVEYAIKALSKYSIFSKVTLSDASTQFITIATSGEKAKAALTEHLGIDLDLEYDGTIAHDNYHLTCVTRTDKPQYEILSNQLDVVKTLWEALDVHAAPVGPKAWKRNAIRQKVPVIYPQTTELFTPQAVNLDTLGAINFNKGCYTGQEIIARTHYKGQSKRHLYSARVALAEAIEPGTKICDSNQKEVGTVVESTPIESNQQELLASLHEQFINNELYVDENMSQALQLIA